ncbi:MAG: hypothetical protein ACXIU8_01600 [Alkalilacustris sp.]
MHLSDAAYEYDCAPCATTGAVCMEGVWLARRLAAALKHASGPETATFNLVSGTCFGGCGRTCDVVVRLTPGRVDITAGTGGAQIAAVAGPPAPAIP